jgi:hypothetical protein
MQVRKSWWKNEEETLNEEEKNCTGLEVDGFERKNPFVVKISIRK